MGEADHNSARQKASSLSARLNSVSALDFVLVGTGNSICFEIGSDGRLSITSYKRLEESRGTAEALS